MTRRASRCAPGTTPTPRRRWSPGWSTTPGRSSPPSTASPSTPNRPTRSACWPWSPAKTSNPATSEGTWRIAQRVAPDRVISTVDPESRHMHKSVSAYRDGYKAHVAVEPETGLITASALTPANAGDGPTGVELLAGEAARPAGAGRLRLRLRRGPRRAPPGAATEPRSKRSRCAADPRRVQPRRLHHRPRRPHRHLPRRAHRHRSPPRAAPPSAPAAAAARSGTRCTTAKDGRTLHIGDHDAELVAARRAWADGDFADDYRQLAAHGRTLHRLARRPRPPPRPLPRRHPQPAPASHPSRRHQPAPTRQPRPRPPQRPLDPRHMSGPGEANEGPHRRAHTQPGRRLTPSHTDCSVRPLPRTHHDPTTTSQDAPCSTAS